MLGILGVLFFMRAEASGPRIGDHWHAIYEITICGERQPELLDSPVAKEMGIHTHDDGLIHLHPYVPAAEEAGARLDKWFQYLGGELTGTSLRLPGEEKTYRNGDLCPDEEPGTFQVFVNGVPMADFLSYIPQDGDRVRIVFGPLEEPLATPTAVAPAVARTITVEAGDQGRGAEDSFFSPNRLTIQAGETVKLVVKNTGTVVHNLHISGEDKKYDTDDDFTTEPFAVKPGKEGSLIVRIDEPGLYPFRCDFHPLWQKGSLTVEAAPEEEPTP